MTEDKYCTNAQTTAVDSYSQFQEVANKSLQGEIVKLKTALENSERQYQQKVNEIATLTDENITLKQKNHDLNYQIAGLKRELEDYRSLFTRIKDMINGSRLV